MRRISVGEPSTWARREIRKLETTHLDRATARRILAGDEAAFRATFDRVFPRLYRYALAHLDGDAESAKDVVQQTFCQAIDKLGSYRGEAPLYAWFAAICRHVLVDHCRRRSRERAHVLLLEDHADVRAVLDALTAPACERPESEAVARDLRRLVQAILDRLPPRYADVLEWKYVEGLTVKEIAGRLASGPKAAESMLSRARLAFREALAAVSGAAGKGVPSP